jgi:hypothetical protein
MSEYKIHFHHSTAKQGHYYIEFASPYLSSTDQKFFGKNPSIANMPIWKGVILDEKDFHSEMKLAKTLITTTREVSREEFLAGYSFAKNVDGGIYTAWGTTTTEDNCITFGQQVHAASGGQAHFINLFSKEQLASANNVAADHSIRNYYDSGARFVSGESIDHVSSVYGVAKSYIIKHLPFCRNPNLKGSSKDHLFRLSQNSQHQNTTQLIRSKATGTNQVMRSLNKHQPLQGRKNKDRLFHRRKLRSQHPHQLLGTLGRKKISSAVIKNLNI